MAVVLPLRQGLALEEALTFHLRYLRAANRSAHTIAGRETGVGQFITFCADHGYSIDDISEVPRQAVEEFLEDRQATAKATTVETRYDQLKAFWNWLVDEDELTALQNPIRKVPRPTAPIEEVDLIEVADIRRLLHTCEGKSFLNRRDAAIIRVLIDAGPRASGVLSMRTEPRWLDLNRHQVRIVLKGGDEHDIPVGNKTVLAINRYLMERGRHPLAWLPDLWVAAKGPFTPSGLGQMLTSRASQAGLGEGVHPHMFRHTFVDAWLAAGGSETELMKIMGWTSRKQLDRYGKKGKVRRARDAHARLSPGDRV